MIAQMICGSHGNPDHPFAFVWPNFPYRNGPKLHRFFSDDCHLSSIPEFAGTRITWTNDVLSNVNEGKASHWGIASDQLVLHVIKKLLESVANDDELKHRAAIDDVNGVLAEDGLRVQFINGDHKITRLSSTDVSLGLVGYMDIEKCLGDFASYVKAERRMSFWEREGNQYTWRSRPERYAQDLLHTSLSMRFGDAVFTFEEVGAGAGRIDIYIVTPVGQKVIVELKMCGGRYPKNYARGGIDQLVHYMENKNAAIGYLMVFDSRSRDFAQGFDDRQTIDIDGKPIVTMIVDVRPEFR